MPTSAYQQIVQRLFPYVNFPRVGFCLSIFANTIFADASTRILIPFHSVQHCNISKQSAIGWTIIAAFTAAFISIQELLYHFGGILVLARIDSTFRLQKEHVGIPCEVRRHKR
jgi:hypothetical protein